MWQMYNVWCLNEYGRQRVYRVHAKNDLMARTMATIMWPHMQVVAVTDEHIQ